MCYEITYIKNPKKDEWETVLAKAKNIKQAIKKFYRIMGNYKIMQIHELGTII
jgi:hypothetical protein